jgi:hypothetical protein
VVGKENAGKDGNERRENLLLGALLFVHLNTRCLKKVSTSFSEQHDASIEAWSH